MISVIAWASYCALAWGDSCRVLLNCCIKVWVSYSLCAISWANRVQIVDWVGRLAIKCYFRPLYIQWKPPLHLLSIPYWEHHNDINQMIYKQMFIIYILTPYRSIISVCFGASSIFPVTHTLRASWWNPFANIPLLSAAHFGLCWLGSLVVNSFPLHTHWSMIMEYQMGPTLSVTPTVLSRSCTHH